MRVRFFGWGPVLLFVLTLGAPAVYAGEGILPLYKGFWQPRNTDALKMSGKPEWFRSMGANALSVQAAYRPLEDGSFKPPSPKGKRNILQAIEQAHANGLKVYLVPSFWIPRSKPNSRRAAEYLASFEPIVLHWAEIAERLGVEIFSPANEPDMCFTPQEVSTWHQKLLPQIRERYSGIVLPKMMKMEKGDYRGFDYIGFNLIDARLREDHVARSLKKALAFARRDKVPGVIISEFRINRPDMGLTEQANWFDAVFRLTHGRVAGYFISADKDPDFKLRFRPAEETIRKWFTKRTAGDHLQ